MVNSTVRYRFLDKFEKILQEYMILRIRRNLNLSRLSLNERITLKHSCIEQSYIAAHLSSSPQSDRQKSPQCYDGKVCGISFRQTHEIFFLVEYC